MPHSQSVPRIVPRSLFCVRAGRADSDAGAGCTVGERAAAAASGGRGRRRTDGLAAADGVRGAAGPVDETRPLQDKHDVLRPAGRSESRSESRRRFMGATDGSPKLRNCVHHEHAQHLSPRRAMMAPSPTSSSSQREQSAGICRASRL